MEGRFLIMSIDRQGNEHKTIYGIETPQGTFKITGPKIESHEEIEVGCDIQIQGKNSGSSIHVTEIKRIR